jgi:hypothetical protein
MWFVRVITVLYGVFTTLAVLSTLRYLGSHAIDRDVAKVRSDLIWFTPIYLTLAVGFYLLYALHSSYRPGPVRLLVFPFGISVWMGKVKRAVPWTSFDCAGRTDWFLPTIDGLKAKDRLLGLGGISLSPYDPNWREGEIGDCIRRYAPRLLGIDPVDPEAGSTIF